MPLVIMVAGALTGLVIVVLARRSLRPLITLRLRWSWLIFAALGLQLLITTFVPDMGSGPSKLIHLGSYVCVLAFLGRNWRLPGVTLILLGAVLNLSAIVANDGVMPARAGALRTAGIVETHEFENSAPVAHARLQPLGDVFAVPASVPLANVFSVGDVVIDIGAILLIVLTCFRAESAPPEPDPEDTSTESGRDVLETGAQVS
jgi:hypothetical protein